MSKYDLRITIFTDMFWAHVFVNVCVFSHRLVADNTLLILVAFRVAFVYGSHVTLYVCLSLGETCTNARTTNYLHNITTYHSKYEKHLHTEVSVSFIMHMWTLRFR